MSKTGKRDVKQLHNLNFDLANYFANTIIPQLFVDADLILRIFTPPAMKQFSLTHKDINRSIHEVKDNIRYPTIIENIEEVIATKKVIEKEVQTTDGNWFEMNILPYIEHEKDRVNGVIITFVNITNRLRALRELEKLNAKHEILMFALSHDLRQPLSSIILFTEGLKEAFKQNDSEKFEKWIKDLKGSTNNLKTLIEDFTSENDPHSKESYSGDTENLKEISMDVIESLKEEIKYNKIKVTTEFNVLELKFPKNNLRSIIYNLLHNAIKFRSTERVSEVRLTTSNVRDFVVLCLEDNGIGISEEDQTKIFEKSTRLNPTLSGTGMGLFIIKRMIESNNGKIKVTSSPEKGTRFQVFFRSK